MAGVIGGGKAEIDSLPRAYLELVSGQRADISRCRTVPRLNAAEKKSFSDNVRIIEPAEPGREQWALKLGSGAGSRA